MAMDRTSVALNNATFPFLYEQTFRTVTQSQDVAPRMPSSFYGSVESQNLAVPDVVFVENVLPVAKGIMSVSFALQAKPPGGQTQFDQGILLRDVNENHRTFVPAGGLNYIYDPGTQTWASKSPFTFANTLITRAYVNGRSFVCYEKTKIVEYDMGTSTLNDLTGSITFPAGITIANVRGIGACAGYLLLFTDIAIYWCAPTAILDFNTLDQGAGNQTPEDIGGQIIAIAAISGGAIIYTQGNAVAMKYTKNTQAPFIFKGVNGSGGVDTWERVAADTDTDAHYAWTTAGLQRVALDGSETVMTEVTDFLVGGVYEAWNATTKRIDRSEVGRAFVTKLALLLKRYLIISYGTVRKEMGNALIYDTVLRRWGKVSITHCDCFECAYPSSVGPFDDWTQMPHNWTDLGDLTWDELAATRPYTPPAKTGIAFLQRDGTIYVLNTNFTQQNTTGVVVLGHVQSTRSKQVTLHSVEFEGVRNAATATVTILTSDKGHARDRNQTAIYNTAEATDLLAPYNCRITGENHDIALEGAFVLTAAIVESMQHGYR